MTNAKKQSGGRGGIGSPEVQDYKRIWAGARELGMERELVHDLAESVCGRSLFSEAKGEKSLTLMSRAERWKLIQDLKSKGAFRFKGEKSKKSEKGKKGGGYDIITPGQQEFIETLFIELASLAPDFGKVEYRRGFIRIVLSKEWPQKKWEAQKVIEAVKRRIAQERKRIGAAGGSGAPTEAE